MNTFTYPASADATSEIASVDEAADGIALGHGLLGSMLSWTQPAIDAVAPLIAGVETPDLSQVDPKQLQYPGGFDPALLMRGLLAYETHYHSRLHGDGLLLSLGAATPPTAFAVVDATFGGPESAPPSFARDDYEDGDAYARVLSQGSIVAGPSPQRSWLVNAALARAAVRMAPFVFGEPTLVTGYDTCVVVFSFAGTEERVAIAGDSSPPSLHRQVRLGLQRTWSGHLGRELLAVIGEFAAALARQGAPEDAVQRLRTELWESVEDDKALKKMQHSSGAFINIRRIAAFATQEVAAMDREAIRHALRHSTFGLTWRCYLVHREESLRGEVRACEEDGALAFSLYSASALTAMASGARAAPSLNVLRSGDASNEAAFSQQFLRALISHADGQVVKALKSVSPRYLCTLVLGNGVEPSLARKYASRIGAPEESDQTLAAERAGRRLAGALNTVFQVPSKQPLPWARVLACHQAYELMLADSGDDHKQTRALTHLIQLANHARGKGARAAAIGSLPETDELLSAPEDATLATFTNLHGPAPGAASKLAGKSSLRLIAQLLDSALPVQTVATSPAGSTRMTWSPGYASVWRWHQHDEDLLAGFDVALSVGAGRRQLWCVAHVYARLFEDSAAAKESAASVSDLLVEIRGAGTPDRLGPLILQVGVPERFKRLVGQAGAHTRQLAMAPLLTDGMKTPYLQEHPRPASRPKIAYDHGQALGPALARAISGAIARRPFHAAAAFPAVAKFLWRGGKLADGQQLRPLGSAAAWQLARACLGSENPHGLGLICRHAKDPGRRSSSGASLLDLALESSSPLLGMTAIHGLSLNPSLAADERARLVQSSLGKLVERHPGLLEQALNAGATMTDETLLAWRRVHPARRTPELEALVTSAAMGARIEATAPQAETGGLAKRRPRRSV